MPVTLEAFGLDKLSSDDKAELIGLLEADLAAEAGEPPVTPEQLAELQRRIARMDADPGRGVTLEVAIEAARARSRARRGVA